MPEEKRKSVRVKTTLFVQYCYNNSQGNKTWDITTVKDISETGVCVKTVKDFEVGAIISLRFKIPSRPFDKTDIAGKVVTCSRIGQNNTWITRIDFTDLNNDTKALLHEYISWVISNSSTN